MQFSLRDVKVEEHQGLVHIPIVRSGDLSFESSVRCFTRQRSASVMMDFDERRNTDEYRIVFAPGEKVGLKVEIQINRLQNEGKRGEKKSCICSGEKVGLF